MLFCHLYYHQKAKYYKHNTIQQMDSWCWKMWNLRESNYSRKGLLAKECLKYRLVRKADKKMMSKILFRFKVFLISFHLK